MPGTKQRESLERGLQEEIRKREEEIDVMRRTLLILNPTGAPPNPPVGLSYSEGSFSSQILGAIHQALTEHGSLPRKEILKYVQDKGVHIGGKSPANAVSHFLSADPRFVKAVLRGHWTLAGHAKSPDTE